MSTSSFNITRASNALSRSSALQRLLNSSKSNKSQLYRRSFHATACKLGDALDMADTFARRHMGPRERDSINMLKSIGFESMDELFKSTVPPQIMADKELDLDPALSESEALAKLREMANKNKVMKSYIGAGYYDTQVPPVILRNMLENPGWYTAYTPYQAEIAQGRLEMLLNFQTMVCDLTGLPMAVASLLDESTAAAEAMQMSFALKGKKGKKDKIFCKSRCSPTNYRIDPNKSRCLGS